MPLIKSTIFKPHGPSHVRDDIYVYLMEIGDEYREQFIDRIMQTHCLLQSARCVDFQNY